MSTPIYKKNVINDVMKLDFKIFEKFWMRYYNILNFEQYEFNKFIKIIIKIKNSDFDFNESDIKDFNEFLKNISDYIYKYKDYTGQCEDKILYNEEDLICCHRIKNHLKLISESSLNYKNEGKQF